MKNHPVLLVFTFCFVFYCSFAQDPRLVIPVGHNYAVDKVTFSPDGKIILTTSSDGTAKLWDTKTALLLNTLKIVSLQEKIYANFSPDSKRIVTTDAQHVKVWDVNSGNILVTLENRFSLSSSFFSEAFFSPDGKSIVAGNGIGNVLIWDSYSGIVVIRLITPNSPTQNAAYSSDGKSILSKSGNQAIIIWDAQNGNLLKTLKTKDEYFGYVGFNRDGKSVLTISNEGIVKVWNAQSGKRLLTLEGINADYASYSPDGNSILTGGKDVRLWDALNGDLLLNIEIRDQDYYEDARFSPDGKNILSLSSDTVKIWDARNGKLLNQLEVIPNTSITSIAFSPDGERVAAATNQSNLNAIIWDVKSGNHLNNLKTYANLLLHASFSPDGNSIVIASLPAKIIDMQNGRVKKVLSGHTDWISSANFSPDGKTIVTASYDNTAKIWDVESGNLLSNLKGHKDKMGQASFSPDGKKIVTSASDFDMTAKIWDVQGGELVQDIHVGRNSLTKANFSPDAKSFITIGYEIHIWDAQTGELKHDFPDDNNMKVFHDAAYSPDGKKVVSAHSLYPHWDPVVIIWEPQGDKPLDTLATYKEVYKTIFSQDGNNIVTAAIDDSVKVWDVNNYQLKRTFNIKGKLEEIHWPSNRMLTRDNAQLFLYDYKTGAELLSFVIVDSIDWVVTHPSGLFDASPGAMDKLYFVQGLDIIDFSQLKERYYEPGLWKKVMAGEELRSAVGMKSIELPPDIQVGQVDGEGYLNINLTNRGGGIGEVNLFVNGKEMIKDARDASTKPDAPNASIKVFVGKHKSIVKGQENLIAVKAWNKDHWVQSRGQIVSYQSKEIESYKPAVHILTCGVSDYTGNEIDLKYAAKDANDVSVALQLGAKKLFGAERSYVYNLTTSQPKEFYPTKTNILKAFEKISSTAHPLDIFVMYVSGHGINYGGQDGDWHYLTQEAYTGSGAAYNDPAIRAQTTISSNELVELFKKVPALKQVLMLDACASGKVVDNLMAQKDIESSTLRALDRMRDRTGMHIITGCTADAVSYEASKYGQGVLTYSLLEGIRGAALREDQYVDVNKLFQYAQDRVPQLAEGIGGIQSPQVFSPQGSQSFDIGLLSDDEKKEIPIAKIRPVFVRSNFQDENELEDVLGLSKQMDEALNEVSSKAVESTLIFVDVREYPEGCKLSGLYKREGGKIVLKLRKRCGTEDKTFDLKSESIEGIKKEIWKTL